MAPLVRRTWSPRGCTPVLHQRGRHHRKVSSIAAICVSPQRDRVRLYFRLHSDANVDAAAVVAFLDALHRRLGRVCLVWDRLQAHRARVTQGFIHRTPDFQAHYFPAYAPELNPMEYGWSWLKTNPLANLPCPTVVELADAARRHSRSLQRQHDLLRGFVRHSPLPLRLRLRH